MVKNNLVVLKTKIVKKVIPAKVKKKKQKKTKPGTTPFMEILRPLLFPVTLQFLQVQYAPVIVSPALLITIRSNASVILYVPATQYVPARQCVPAIQYAHVTQCVPATPNVHAIPTVHLLVTAIPIPTGIQTNKKQISEEIIDEGKSSF
jgi:hypothetical protein